MGIGKQGPSPGEPIDVRCSRLRMAAKTTHPVIEIIDGKHKDVESLGFYRVGTRGCEAAKNRCNQDGKTENRELDGNLHSNWGSLIVDNGGRI